VKIIPLKATTKISCFVDVPAGDPLEGVAGVDDEVGLGGDPGIVIGRVVSTSNTRSASANVGSFSGVDTTRRTKTSSSRVPRLRTKL